MAKMLTDPKRRDGLIRMELQRRLPSKGCATDIVGKTMVSFTVSGTDIPVVELEQGLFSGVNSGTLNHEVGDRRMQTQAGGILCWTIPLPATLQTERTAILLAAREHDVEALEKARVAVEGAVEAAEGLLVRGTSDEKNSG